MTGRDLLESGSARPPSRTAQARRLGTVAVVVLAAVAVAVAARSSGEPPPRTAAAPPAPVAAPAVRPPSYYLYDAAVAGGRVYALAGFCVGRCGYRLLRWDGTRWSGTTIAVPADALSPGRLLVTGRYLTVNLQLPGGGPGDPPLIPTVLRRGGDTVAAITADGGHLLVRHDHQAAWTIVRLPA